MNNADNFMQLPPNFQNGIIQCTNIVLEQNIPDLVSIILFGSCARNEINVMSDIDIAIVTKDVIHDRSIRGSIRSDFENLDNELSADAVFTTIEELNNSDKWLYRDIRRDGIVLWKDGEYMPFMDSYLAIAKNDYAYLSAYAEKSLDKFPRNIAIESQQVVEKYLKSLLNQFCAGYPDAKRLLKTHNLVAINDALVDSGIDLGLDDRDLAILTLCWNTSYPGDDFINVSKERADCAYKTANQVKAKTEEYLAQHNYCTSCGSKILETGECSNKSCDYEVPDVDTTTTKSNVFNKE